MASTTVFKLPPQKPLNSTNKRSSDLREHLSAFTLSGCSSSSTSSIIYRFLLSAYSLSILSSVFLLVSLVRVSFHMFLSSARRPSSFVHRQSLPSSYCPSTSTSSYHLCRSSSTSSYILRLISFIFRHFVRIRVAIVHNIVGPC
jgi:hypothetical protein